MRLTIITSWDQKNKDNTWSGTPAGLVKALGQLNEIEDLDVGGIYNPPFILRKLQSIISRHFHFYNSFFDLKRIKAIRKYLAANNLMKKGIYFQYEEIVQDSDCIDTYIYIDESVDHVLHMYLEEPDIFSKSNFQCLGRFDIRPRLILQQLYFKQCAGIFTMGKWLADDLVNRTGIPSSKVFAVGGGVNVDIDSVEKKLNNNNAILFVGKDFERKGGYVVYEAFKILKKRIPNATLHIAGPEENPIKENFDGVVFHGFCNRDQMNKLYNFCDIFAMPSYYEAYGLVFIEALTFGLPCLGRNCYEMPNIIQDGITGRLINDDNIHEISDAMYELLTDTKYKNNVAGNKSYYIEEYSWKNVAKRISDVISNHNI